MYYFFYTRNQLHAGKRSITLLTIKDLEYDVLFLAATSSSRSDGVTKGWRPKKNSIFTDIVQIDGDPPPSYLIFDKFIFDTVLIMLTSTSIPPLELLTKIMKF